MSNQVNRWKKKVTLLILLCLSVGIVSLFYSGFYDRSGLRAVDFHWGYPTPAGPFEFNLTSEEPIRNIVIWARRVEAVLNTSGVTISALLSNGTDHLLVNLSMVSGDRVTGLMWPQENPTGWVHPQNYTISLIWERVNTTAAVTYWTYALMHGDAFVYSFLPEYFVFVAIGNAIIAAGLMLAWISQLYLVALSQEIKPQNDQLRILSSIGIITGLVVFLVPISIAGFLDSGYEVVISAMAWSWRAEGVFFPNMPQFWIVIIPFVLLKFAFARELVMYRLHASSRRNVVGFGLLNGISLLLIPFVIIFAYPLPAVGHWWACPIPVLLVVGIALSKVGQKN